MASIEIPPAAASGANDSTGDAPVVSDASTQEYQSTQPIITPSASLNAERDNQQLTTGLPSKSLFGPFPETADTSNVDRHPTAHPETRQLPISQPSDQIEPSKENWQEVNQPALKLDPQDPEPLSSVQVNRPSTPNKSPLPPLTREKTAPAIGPATDKPTPVPKQSEIEGPALYITLLLSSTGARHPYKLDEKYLRKRNVAVDGNNPINMSLYKLKELILRDWRDEWEAKPSSPESIRLISMGKMLNDKARLSDCGFTNGTTPHIIHMTIKPHEIVDEEDAKMKAGGSNRAENERSPGCRCIIQ